MAKQPTDRRLKKFQEYKAQKQLEAKTKAAGEEIVWSRIRKEPTRANDETVARHIKRWRNKRGLVESDLHQEQDEHNLIQEVQKYAPGVSDLNTALWMRQWKRQMDRRQARQAQQ